MTSCCQNKDEDSDSGLVDDAFDVLPDEETLALDDDLDLDLTEDSFGDYSDLLELDETTPSVCSNLPEDPETDFLQDISTDDGFVESTHEIYDVNSKKEDVTLPSSIEPAVPVTMSNTNPRSHCENSGKLVSFSKEQARQWRRKRILKSNEKKITQKDVKNCPTKLEALLPLPKNLKPISNKGKQTGKDVNSEEKVIRAEDKLADPLLGGEKISTRTKRGYF